MRLALVLFYAHFFFSGTLAQPDTHSMSLDVASPRCAHVLAPVVLAAQAFDLINTRNQMTRYPNAREVDWWSARFAGPRGRNVVGIAAGMAILDEIKWRLTAHSPALRCAVEANQLETTIDAIRVTHPR